MDGVELFHAATEGNWPGRLVVAVPPTQPGDDPRSPCETSRLMAVLLSLGAAFRCWPQRSERVDFWLAERSTLACGRRRRGPASVGYRCRPPWSLRRRA